MPFRAAPLGNEAPAIPPLKGAGDVLLASSGTRTDRTSPVGLRLLPPRGEFKDMKRKLGTGKYEKLLRKCKSFEPVPTAAAHPLVAVARGVERRSMNPKRQVATFRSLAAMLCAIALVPGETLAYVTSSSPLWQSSTQGTATKIPPEQLDSLVAPIALYPDPLLAQTLAASTYPLEIIQLQQWLAKNPGLKDKALADAVAKQPWDPSVQAMAGLPEVVKRLADDVQWTADLGNAFLAQQSDVMDAVQRMRKKAMDKGTLKTTEQQKVETKVVETKQVIVVEQANPQVVYVPSYDPVVVWGPPVYPYPPIYYPPWGYYAAGVAISFGVGMMMGAFWSGGWGWGCGWGGNDIDINRNNNFNRNTNIGNSGNRVNALGDRGGAGNRGGAGGNKWQHNPQHRGGAPYRDRATADRFGGSARGDSLGNRQASARQQIGRQGGNLASSRPGTGVSNRAGSGGLGNRASGAGSGSFGNRTGGGADRIGSRDLSRSGGGSRDAFGGGSRGYSGSSDRAGSSRGSSSWGSRSGGGGSSRGGGGRGGGGRR
jgi:hypothetical protein